MTSPCGRYKINQNLLDCRLCLGKTGKLFALYICLQITLKKMKQGPYFSQSILSVYLKSNK